jgi:hypothetical protein
MGEIDVQSLVGKDPRSLTDAELLACAQAETASGMMPGELPAQVAERRYMALESPSFLATQILDPWYERHFERDQYVTLDEVMAPWMLGEPVTIDGSTYDPKQYTGLLVLKARNSLKSSMLRILSQWLFLKRKLVGREDARIMFCHQVIDKAVKHSIAVRRTARENRIWRETFPEFRAPGGKEWDTKSEWRWPCFTQYQATEYSWVSYGETSSKEGGHYTDRIVDDWVTSDSVTTDAQLEQSYSNFRAMDHLGDRHRPYKPWIACGTNYHYLDCYKRLESQGGWLVLRTPAHTGSPKKIFEICAIDEKSEEGRKKIEVKLRRLEKDPPGELNFPKMLPWRELYRSARMEGPNEYNCQLLLNPIPEGEQRFDHEALDESWVDEPPIADQCYLYIRIDPAISQKRSADETAIVVGAVTWDAKRTLIDGWVGREKRPTGIVLRAFTLAAKWKAKGYTVKNIGFESVAYQEALAEIARYGVPEREATYQGESVPIITKPCPVRSIKRSPDIRKQERIMEMDGPVTRRELKFWKRCPIADRAMRQFKGFPFDRDDILDAVHDLWVDTRTPARVMRAETPKWPPQILRFLERMDRRGEPQLRGTNNTVKLTAWGR